MQKIINRIIVCFCSLMIISFPSHSLAKKNITKVYKPKYAAIVMDADSGQILENEDADGIRHPASLTKMMTLYIVFECLKSGRLHLNTPMQVSSKASRQSPSKLGLNPGETITVFNAIMGLATKSANDVAVVIAEHLSGSEEAFARRMTQKAHALKMMNTIFKNASGLPNPGQITTARDMAKLSQALYRDFPKEYGYFRHQTFSYKGAIHRNHNHLLGKVSGLDGIKTGFISASGFNIAVSAVRKDAAGHPHRLIAVVLGGENRHWRDRRATELLETNFERLGINDQNDVMKSLVLKTIEPATSETIEAIDNSSENFEDIIHEVAFSTNEDQEETNDNSESNSPPPQGWVRGELTPTVKTGLQNVTTPKKSKSPTIHSDHLVQVGQFRRQNEAKSTAIEARKLAAAGHPEAVKVRKSGKYFYAARLSGLTQTQANGLCQKWQAKGKKCQNLGRLVS